MNVRTVCLVAAAVAWSGASGLADEAASQPASEQSPTPAEKLIAAEKTAVAAVEKGQGVNRIDWTAGQLIAAGTAKVAGKTQQDIAMAHRAARLLAIRNAAVLAAAVRIGPDGKVNTPRNGNISATLQVRGAEELSAVHNPHTGTLTVRVAVPLYGVNGVVGVRGIAPSGARQASLGRGPGSFDVLVVDARGSGFRPCLTPRITDESRNVLLASHDLEAPVLNYVVMPAPRESAFGPIQRARNVSALAGRAEEVLQKAANTAFTSPLLLRAQESPANETGTLVLDRRSVTHLRTAGNGQKLFQQRKIVVVIDAP